MRDLELTTFPRSTDHGGTRFTLSREEFVRALSTSTDDDGLLHARHVEKDDLPLFCLATFDEDYVEGAGVELVHALGFDVDEMPVPSADALRALGAAGIFFPSSSATPDAPRWRLFLWLTRPVTGSEYYRLWSFVAGRFPFPVGQAAKDPSRGWYVPREPAGGAFEVHTIDGHELDVDALLAIAPAVAVPTYEHDEDGEGPGVEPVDISTPHGRAMIERATEYLRNEAIPCVSGEGGQGRAFRVAMRLMRGYKLPLDCAMTLWLDVYNDRCSPPWEEHEIERKLAHARDRASTPTGLPSPGFLETWGLPPDVKDTMRAPRRAIATINADRRRVRRADHAYTFTPNAQARSDAAKITVGDAIHALTSRDEWRGVFQYDDFRKTLLAVDPPMRLDAESTGLSEEDVTNVSVWFAAHGMLITKDTVRDAIRAAAKMQRFHPVLEYLHGLPDCAPAAARAYLEALPGRVLGVDAEHARVWLARYLVAAVRRVLTPGTKVDAMLVLQGGQGAGKSTFCEALFGREWFRDQMPDLSNRDASHALEGNWGIEIAELEAVLRAETRTVKEFLSRSVDKYRAYGTGEKVQYARECVFIATSNETEILRDPTGERRFQPIALPEGWRIDVDWVRANRDAIWSAALALAMLPTSKERPDLVVCGGTFDHWTTLEEDARMALVKEAFHEVDPWQDMLRDACRGRVAVEASADLYVLVIAPKDESATAKLTRQISKRISDCMLRLGCRSQAVRIDGRVCRGWRVPETLANEVPSPNEARRRAQRANAEESARLASKAGRPS